MYDAVMLLSTTILAAVLLAECLGGRVPDWVSQTIIGAAVGSVMSAWWRRAVRWQVNVAAGFFIGWFGGDWVIAAASIPPESDYQRAIGAGLALIGFSLIDAAIKFEWGGLLRKVIEARTAKCNLPP